MKRPFLRKLSHRQLVSIGATAGLCLLAAALIVFGWLYAGPQVLMAGLIVAMPALVQLILLLPITAAPAALTLDPALHKIKAKLLTLWYQFRLHYSKLRNTLAVILIAAAMLAAHLVFWRCAAVPTKQLSYLTPVVLAVVFVAAIALEKWCAHITDKENIYTAALLKSVGSALTILRIAVLLCAVAITLALLGLYDARYILQILLGILFVYETAVLAFCLGVRIIRKDLDTKPELPVNLIGMGADMNILTYLEKNTGITMRSLWSLRLIKKLLPGAILSIALLIWLSTCFVQIEAHQQGALFRLGKLQDTALQPGLHVTLPWPFDKVDIYDTGAINKVTIGYIPQGEQDNTWTKAHGEEEYLLLLGNGNEMVSINLQVEYRIEDLLAYIRSSSSPEDLLQAQAYEIITSRTIVTDLDTLLAADREVFSETFREELSQRIAPYHTGLAVVNVVLESIHPPVNIANVYQKTVSAGIEAGFLLLEAEASAATRLLSAQEQSTKIISNAMSNKYEQIAAAQAAVTEFMAASAADSAHRDAYRFYKYLDAITQSYQNSTLIIAGNGIDTSRLIISTYKEELEEPEPLPGLDGDAEFEEEYFMP